MSAGISGRKDKEGGTVDVLETVGDEGLEFR